MFAIYSRLSEARPRGRVPSRISNSLRSLSPGYSLGRLSIAVSSQTDRHQCGRDGHDPPPRSGPDRLPVARQLSAPIQQVESTSSLRPRYESTVPSTTRCTKSAAVRSRARCPRALSGVPDPRERTARSAGGNGAVECLLAKLENDRRGDSPAAGGNAQRPKGIAVPC